MFKNFNKNKYNSGVTLIELLVVISIFVIISTTTIFSYGKFNSSLSLQNLSDDIALSVRKAQGYAIGVRGISGSFSDSYGIHFTLSSANPLYKGSNKSFILFADISGDNQYYQTSSTCGIPTSTNECLELLSITSADKIIGISLNGDSINLSTTDSIDLLFKRPNPEPTFCYRTGGSGSCSATSISDVKIKIASDNSPATYKTIIISNNGQISVSN